MVNSWWEFGEWTGFRGNELDLRTLACAFCNELGHYSIVHHVEKKKPNASKKLNFETLQCSNCSNYALAFWASSGDGTHDRKLVPWPLKLASYPDHWPEAIGRFWLQAHQNLRDKNLDAACVMARSAMQAALRHRGANGSTLNQEIKDLAMRGMLPPLMVDWATNVRIIGNESAHPTPEQPAASAEDARDVIGFLDFLLEYLFDVPRRIEQFRARRAPKT